MKYDQDTSSKQKEKNLKIQKSKHGRKKRYILVLFTFIIFISIYLLIDSNTSFDEKNKSSIVSEKLGSKNKQKQEKKDEIKNKDAITTTKIEKKSNNIADFKKKVISKWLIIKWDIHLKNDDYLFALQKFSKANKQTPNNPKVISKIADTYFLMKNYKSAYNYYSKIDNREYLDENKIVLSLLYKTKIEDYNFERNWSGKLLNPWTVIKIKELKQEIKKIKLSRDNDFYYQNSLECLINVQICSSSFEKYFKNDEYLWENDNLEKIRYAMDSYQSLKINKGYYKNTLLIWALFENKNYPITIVLSNYLLNSKKNYKPILKILAQSYFELNKLKQANKFLVEYVKIDSKSSDVYYMIWVIAQKNHDYIKSNIFLNLAIEQKYENLENIYRLQLYNYLVLGESKKISSTFDKIIALKQKPDSNDLLLATYYSIINNHLEKASILTDKWLKLYPQKEDFYWFKAWLKIENGELEEATKLLNKAKEINSRNALLILNLARISKIKYEKNKNNFDKAKARFLFQKAIELDSAEIGELAKEFLKEL